MASEETKGSGPMAAAALRVVRTFLLNSWRRLIMLSHYSLILFHHLRLRRAWRLLGRQVFRSLEAGEVNPLLADAVKDSLAKAQALQSRKNRHLQAVETLREKIRASRAAEPPPPPEAESPPGPS